MQLPPPIAAYFTAANGADGNNVAACFTEDAIVHDERREMRGRTAIARWADETRGKYRYRVEPTRVDQEADRTVVTAHLSGSFPGSPIDLPYRFRLAGPQIASLEIGKPELR